MRLGQLVGHCSPGRIIELGRQIVPAWDDVPREMLPRSVETVLRESGQVEQTLQARRPPVMALLRELLESPDFRACRVDVEIRATSAGDEWMSMVAAGELVGRDDSCRIYRRLLAAAWQNDLKLDPSETALLGLLRHELEMTAAEHFLIAYHPDIQPFWRNHPSPFQAVLDALLDHGILFELGDELVLPEEFVPRVRKTLGIHMHRAAARRILERLSNADLKAALDLHHLRISGSKGERLERLIESLTPVPQVLDVVNIGDLRDIARDTGAQISGSKDELVCRLIDHFEFGGDLEAQSEADDEPIEAEEKATSEARFQELFAPLKGRELFAICDRNGLKTSGPKGTRIQVLWESALSERTLLLSLQSPSLKDLCEKHGLDRRGSKDDLVERLVGHHRVQAPGAVEHGSGPASARLSDEDADDTPTLA